MRSNIQSALPGHWTLPDLGLQFCNQADRLCSHGRGMRHEGDTVKLEGHPIEFHILLLEHRMVHK